MNRRTFNKTLFALGCLAVTGSLTYGYAAEIEPNWLEITRHEVLLPRLSSAFDGFRIVQLSDIHIDDWMNYDRLRHVVDQVNALRPDLVVITGDFVTEGSRARAASGIRALANLRAQEGVLGILGNHDYWQSATQIRQLMAENSVRDITQQIASFTRGGAAFHIAGLDDLYQHPWRAQPIEQARPALADLADQASAINRTEAVILLAHEPDVADVAAENGRFDLQLSGHTHGGQVSIPLYGPPLLPPLGRKYVRGWYRVNAMQVYTHRGVGVADARLRFGNRPEIAQFVLRAAA